jgi:hypothetical protein
MTQRETFVNKGTNDAAISASGALFPIQNITEAEKNLNLPHNTLTLSNTSTTCTLYIFLDDASNLNTPDYVLFPSQQLTIEAREGVTYRTVFIYNTHGATDVAQYELKYRTSTVKEVS